MSKQITTKDVQQHNTVDNGLYIIIDGGVYEMSGMRVRSFHPPFPYLL